MLLNFRRKLSALLQWHLIQGRQVLVFRKVLDEWDPEQEYTNFDWKLKKTLTEQFPLPETHVSPEMRRAIKKLDDLGMKDVFCERFPKEKADTYWDYFKNAFSDKRGLRIDLVLASGVLAKSLESIEVNMVYGSFRVRKIFYCFRN